MNSTLAIFLGSVRKRWQVLLVVALFCQVAACGKSYETAEPASDRAVVPQVHEPIPPKSQLPLTARDLDVIRFALTTIDPPVHPRPCFLTTTPHYQWNRTGGWDSLPQEFHDSLPVDYSLAGKACLKRGAVFDIESDQPGWMIWVKITSWISETEVQVETGTWGGPADAVGATTTFEHKEGRWTVKQVDKTWLS